MIQHLAAVELLLFVLGGVAARYDPVVGVTAQPLEGNHQPILEPYGNSYIPASYVRFVEAAGARVVPLRFDMPSDKLKDIMGQINGVLFPGGGLAINDNSSIYANFSREIYDLAVEREIALWGTCMGFQQLMVYSSSIPVGGGEIPVLSPFDSEDLFAPLMLTKDAKSSNLLGGAPKPVLDALSKTNMTVNLHHYGVSPADFEADPKLKKTWRVVATNFGRQGKEFISLVEGINLPFFGAQFHGEKNAWEFNQPWDEPSVGMFVHTAGAIEAVEWIAGVFVERARRNPQSFASDEAFRNASIYNFEPIYTNALSDHTLFEETWVFEPFQ